MDTELEAMLRELHDRQAIRGVVERISRAVDRQDKALLLSCYHADAIDDRGMFVGPPDAFFDWTFPSHLHAFRTHQHYVANHVCDLDGEVAHCETYFIFTGLVDATGQLSLFGGRYVDRMEKRDGVWRIALRKCIVEWGSQLPDAQGSTELNAAVGTIARDLSDCSYERPLESDPARNGLRLGI